MVLYIKFILSPNDLNKSLKITASVKLLSNKSSSKLPAVGYVYSTVLVSLFSPF